MTEGRRQVELQDLRSGRVIGPRSGPPGDWRERVVRVALLAGALLLILGLASLVRDGAPADLAPLVVLPPLEAALLVLLVRRMAVPEDRSFLGRLAAAGFLIRLGGALLVHSSLPPGFFAPDEFTFQDVGWRTLLHLQDLGPRPSQLRGWEVGYYYWNAALFAVFGNAPLAPKLVNVFLGTVSGLVAYRLGGELVGRQGARTAALLVMLFPSLVLWSTLNLRDGLAVLLLVTILWAAMRLKLELSTTWFAALVASLGTLFFIRDYLAVMVLFGLLGSFLLSQHRRLPVNLLVAAGLVAVALFAYRTFDLGSGMLEAASFEVINQQRQNLAIGRTAFAPDADVSTPLRGLQFLPIGLAFFLLSPFPWQIGSPLSLMTLPEQIIWYALLPLVVYGGWFLLRRRFGRVMPMMVFLILTTSIYALVEGNAGTAYRHRGQVLIVMLIFAAAGIEVWRVRRRGHRAR